MRAFNKEVKPKHTTKGKWKLIEYTTAVEATYRLCWEYARRTQVFPNDSGTFCYNKLKLNKGWEDCYLSQ